MHEQNDAAFEDTLRRIVRATPWLLEALAAVRAAGFGSAFVAAGAIRNTVWDFLHDRPSSGPASDIDVVYFDPADVPSSAQHLLSTWHPQFRWEVTNQATVHQWQSIDAARQIPAYVSLEAALASWPETATAVAARLAMSGEVEILAPLGLSDLFELVVRPNPKASNPAAYCFRHQEKGWQLRWPRLSIQPGLRAGDAAR
jgi:uncharacterized protein